MKYVLSWASGNERYFKDSSAYESYLIKVKVEGEVKPRRLITIPWEIIENFME
jgi:hypothetical protein